MIAQKPGRSRTYRNQSGVIEAFCLGIDYIPDWFMDHVSTNEIILRGERHDLRRAEIRTLEGITCAEKGDFVVHGVNGEIYPLKPDIFAATYDPM